MTNCNHYDMTVDHHTLRTKHILLLSTKWFVEKQKILVLVYNTIKKEIFKLTMWHLFQQPTTHFLGCAKLHERHEVHPPGGHVTAQSSSELMTKVIYWGLSFNIQYLLQEWKQLKPQAHTFLVFLRITDKIWIIYLPFFSHCFVGKNGSWKKEQQFR